MKNVTNYQQIREDLAFAHRTFESAKRSSPSFENGLTNTLIVLSDVIEALPISLIDFDVYSNLNLDLTRLRQNLSAKGLEKEAMLAQKISDDIVHKYTTSHIAPHSFF